MNCLKRINQDDIDNMVEELGDVLLQIMGSIKSAKMMDVRNRRCNR